MDDLINELAVQAGAELYGSKQYRNIIVNDQDADDLMRKFARLIAVECAKICYDEDYTSGSGYARAIMKRFGVNE
jgi:hypothetical protein